MNVILIGYRCTGKSTTGKELARIMEIPFVDTDHIIEQTMRSTVAAIVADHGWARFRKIESQVLKGVLAAESMVIATGGGIILDNNNVLAMGSAGTVVWLRASSDTILRRMSQDVATPELRPSLTDKSLEVEIIETLEFRTPLYRSAADMVIDTDLADSAEIAATIKRKLDNGR
ncbi:AroL [Desulforapulum autotrophicum HRM2]|uniref:Shikimate kinase n=1 Tax=Desulforapulum autotrophicum (strain ATCC 43914 / DSM 3382 / VKM B-1955 / HRM2) TaxID=177437 RepID=C0QEK7_DESAH|nr:shikimate kinase [Desulforapulum autotrophicum]ACN15349.1 AroL [Desulforapulum autotrophicum HRM2]